MLGCPRLLFMQILLVLGLMSVEYKGCWGGLGGVS